MTNKTDVQCQSVDHIDTINLQARIKIDNMPIGNVILRLSNFELQKSYWY